MSVLGVRLIQGGLDCLSRLDDDPLLVDYGLIDVRVGDVGVARQRSVDDDTGGRVRLRVFDLVEDVDVAPAEVDGKNNK